MMLKHLIKEATVGIGLMLLLIPVSHALGEVPPRYTPFVSEPTLYPKSPLANSETTILVSVIDVFSKIQQMTLNYSINDGKTWQQTPMILHNGNLSNGTFFATIPPQRPETEVQYKFYVLDDLGYQASTTIKSFVTSIDTGEPYSGDLTFSPDQFHWQKVDVAFSAGDSGSGVRNVTAFYYTNSQMKNITTIELWRQSGDENDGIYRGSLGDIKENTTIYGTVIAEDYAGNRIQKNSTYLVKYPDKHLSIYTTLKEIDTKKLEAKIEFTVIGNIPFEDIPYSTLEIRNIDSIGRPYNVEQIPLLNFSSVNRQIILDKTFYLVGDRGEFPFDKYNLNLAFSIPNNNVQNTKIVLADPNFDFINLRDSWKPQLSSKVTDADRQGFLNLTINRNNIKVAEVGFIITFIFVILGTILLLGNGRDDLTNRLAVSLGVFAFIFAFTPIIDEVRPTNTAGLTIADFAVIIAVIGSISYIVFSVIGHVSKKSYFDFIAFLVPSLFLIILLIIWNLSVPNVWFIPVVTFGLGYGLIVKSGIRKRAKAKEDEATEAS